MATPCPILLPMVRNLKVSLLDVVAFRGSLFASSHSLTHRKVLVDSVERRSVEFLANNSGNVCQILRNTKLGKHMTSMHE